MPPVEEEEEDSGGGELSLSDSGDDVLELTPRPSSAANQAGGTGAGEGSDDSGAGGAGTGASTQGELTLSPQPRQAGNWYPTAPDTSKRRHGGGGGEEGGGACSCWRTRRNDAQTCWHAARVRYWRRIMTGEAPFIHHAVLALVGEEHSHDDDDDDDEHHHHHHHQYDQHSHAETSRQSAGDHQSAKEKYKSRPVMARALCWVPFVGDALLRSVGQVAFVNNTCGAGLVLLGLTLGAPWGMTCAVFATLSAILVALALGVELDSVASGLAGFNAVLCGAAVGIVTPAVAAPSAAMQLFLSVVAGAAQLVAARALAHGLKPHALPAFTLPFNVVALTVLLIVRDAGNMQGGQLGVTATEAPLDGDVAAASVRGPAASEFADTAIEAIAIGSIKGVAQIWLVESWVASVLVLLGALLFSPLASAMLLGGSTLGTVGGWLIGANLLDLAVGLWGFNGALTAVALGAGLFLKHSVGAGVHALLDTFIAVAIQAALGVFLKPYGLPSFTLPFCLATMVVLSVVEESSNEQSWKWLRVVRQGAADADVHHARAHRHKDHLHGSSNADLSVVDIADSREESLSSSAV